MYAKHDRYIISLSLFFILLLFSVWAVANSLAWETPLATLHESLAGPDSRFIATIGLFVAGALILFGGELSDFARRITWICLAISILVAGSSYVNGLFNFQLASSAALVYLDSVRVVLV